MNIAYGTTRSYPLITSPAPMLALTGSPDGLWAGGPGGAAWLHDGTWELVVANLPITSVAALMNVNGWVIAGGANGIARSPDRGGTWLLAETEGAVGAITAIVAAPDVQQSSTLLAASLQHGILRSTDNGQGWRSATFGLETLEVTALVWVQGEIVVAATLDGLYRSPNSGRAWRACAGTEGRAFAALAVLPDHSIVAALEVGGVLRSQNDGATWTQSGELPDEIEIVSLHTTREGVLLLGSVKHGMLRSVDNGVTWQLVAPQMAWSFVAHDRTIYAGTEAGVIGSSDGGATWHDYGSPPLHDLRRLLVIDGVPVVVGITSAPVRFDGDAWQPIENVTLPLTGFAVAPNGILMASSLAGLVRSTDGGTSWQTLVDGVAGCVAHITLHPGGVGWAGSADGSNLLHTADHGQTWVQKPSPFGVYSLAALQALADQVVAATYDARRQQAQFWRSFDNGTTWERGAELRTGWPIVATSDAPPLLTLGDSIVVQQEDGHWRQTRISSGGVRRIVGEAAEMIALTTTGLYTSPDRGATWKPLDIDLPQASVMDVAVHDRTLFVLLAGGQVLQVKHGSYG